MLELTDSVMMLEGLIGTLTLIDIKNRAEVISRPRQS